MTKRFEMSMMGELKFFLGFQIKQLKDGTFISQTKYTNDILKKFDMNNAMPIKTPKPSNGHIDLNEEGKSIDQKVYHSMIGSLLYRYACRPDIMLSVCLCARFCETWVPLGPHRPGSRPSPTSGSGPLEDPPTC
jgi:hypothetical protein